MATKDIIQAASQPAYYTRVAFIALKAAELIRPVVSDVSAQVSATKSACGTSFTSSPMA